ncbi:MAG: DUF4391 domain-containing protein [Bacillota bacterium]|nr:DUF4391 domain-containing protein [Bacillota bacterium]
MNKLFDYMKIPPFCAVGNTVFKKLFYESADLSKADKDLFTEQIDKIIWAYCFKPDTININPYQDELREYAEIEIIEVRLHTAGKIKRMAEIIMRTIPYPMLLVFSLDNKFQLCAAHQRTSLADQSRNTIEEFIFTDWIELEKLTDKDEILLESLQLQNLSHVNYFRFYSDIVDRLIIYNASKLTEEYIEGKDVLEVKEIYDEIGKIDALIKSLKLRIKSDDQINRRVEMNIEINQLEERKNELLERMV